MRQYTTPHEGKPTATGRARQPSTQPRKAAVPGGRARPGKRWPFTLQKATSCRAKDGLLKGERPHLATRRTAAALPV